MKLTRNINLHGVVLTIDEDAYQALKDYLSDIERRLPEDEKTDVMEDLESRIAELLQSALFARSAQAVTIFMIEDIKHRIGDPSEFGENKRPVIKQERFDRQSVGRVLTIIFKAILIIIAIQLMIPVLAVLFGLLMALFGIGVGGLAILPALPMLGWTIGTGWMCLLVMSLIVVVAMPIYMIVHWIVKWSRERKHPSLKFWLITLLIWLLSFGGLTAAAIHVINTNDNAVGAITTIIDDLDDLDDPDDIDEGNEANE